MTPNSHSAGFCAVVTPPLHGAIGVVRVWGDCEPALAKLLNVPKHDIRRTPGTVRRVRLHDHHGVFDDALLTVHGDAPQLDVRIHTHGNPTVVRQCIDRLCALGLREQALQTPIFDSDDPLEREAAALSPCMLTRKGCEWLLRQPTRLRDWLTNVRTAINAGLKSDPSDQANAPWRTTCRRIADRASCFQWFSKPLRVAIVGPPNAGKSTLVNRLVDRDVSLVSNIAGTTRDWVTGLSERDGFLIEWLDTAGIRASDDPLEAAGVEAAHAIAHEVNLVLLLLPADEIEPRMTAAILDAWDAPPPAVVALNKTDLVSRESILTADALDFPPGWPEPLPIAARAGAGLEILLDQVLFAARRPPRELNQPAAFSAHLESLFRCMSAAGPNVVLRLVSVALEQGPRGVIAPPEPSA